MPETQLREPRSFGPASKSTGAEIPELEDDNYRAMVKDVHEGTSTYDGEEKDQYVIEWELLDEKKPNGEPVTLRSYVAIPPSLVNEGVVNEKSNLYGLLRAFGYTDEDLEVDPQAWQGQELRITVVNKEIKSGDNKGQIRPRVTGYLPRKGTSRPAPATPAQRAGMPAAAKRTAPPVADGEDF